MKNNKPIGILTTRQDGFIDYCPTNPKNRHNVKEVIILKKDGQTLEVFSVSTSPHTTPTGQVTFSGYPSVPTKRIPILLSNIGNTVQVEVHRFSPISKDTYYAILNDIVINKRILTVIYQITEPRINSFVDKFLNWIGVGKSQQKRGSQNRRRYSVFGNIHGRSSADYQVF